MGILRYGLLALGMALGMALGAGSVSAQAAVVELRATTVEPRAFGYQVGDLVRRVVRIDVPEGSRLDPETLPQAGRVGSALELRQIERHEASIAGGRRIVLTLDFQIFAAPVAPRIVELPALRLGFGGSRPEELRVDPWPLSVAPLVAEEVPSRHGLGALRPDQPPPPADTAGLKLITMAALALAALLAAWLVVVYVGLPRWGRPRPFGQAWRELRAEGRRGQLVHAEGGRLAARRLHAALNEAAGRVLLAEALDAFLATSPRYAPLRGELLRFFEDSRSGFFGGMPQVPGIDVQRVMRLARALRDAERGTA